MQPALAPLSPPRRSYQLSEGSSLLLIEPTHSSPNQSSSIHAAKKQTKAPNSAHDVELPSQTLMGSHMSEEAVLTPRSWRGQRQRYRGRHLQKK